MVQMMMLKGSKDMTTETVFIHSRSSNPKACLRDGAFGSKYGFSASAVTLVPWRGSLPS